MTESQSGTPQNWKEQFMACLTVPVLADMRQQEAIALLGANKPDSLFRYRPLDKEREFENIERQRVWLSQPLSANDPFDSSFRILHHELILPEDAQKRITDWLSEFVGNQLDPSEVAEFSRFPDIPDERFKLLFRKAFPDTPSHSNELMLQVAREVTTKSRAEHAQQLNEFTKQNLSICCFSETRDSMLMWTHYADQHRGCCIEFDVRRLFIPEAVGFLLPVIYEDELFNITPYYSAIATGGGNNWSAMLAACRKTKAWSYEREWRLVFAVAYPKEKAHFTIPIKSLIMGLRVEKQVQRRLFEIAQKLDVPLFRTLPSSTESILLFEPVTNPP
jgi:hypothetical protein